MSAVTPVCYCWYCGCESGQEYPATYPWWFVCKACETSRAERQEVEASKRIELGYN
jgi:hypothetical protein